METIITSGDDWCDEESFFDARRHDPTLEIVDKKWSEGSSPIMLVKWGHIKKTPWEECGWYQYPSSARCWECQHSKQCPNYTT